MTLEELVLCILNKNENNDKNKEEKIEQSNIQETSDEIYSINQLIKKYPIFTRYSLNKAMKENGLPYFSLGSKKYFKKSDVDNWLCDQHKRKK